MCVLVVQDGVEFIELMSSCVPVCTKLLGSKVNTDILESLEFLATAFEFQVSIKRATYYIAPSPPPLHPCTGPRVKRRGEESSGIGLVSGTADQGFSRRDLRQAVP